MSVGALEMDGSTVGVNEQPVATLLQDWREIKERPRPALDQVETAEMVVTPDEACNMSQHDMCPYSEYKKGIVV